MLYSLFKALRMICSPSCGDDGLGLHLILEDHVFSFEMSHVLLQLVVLTLITWFIYLYFFLDLT